MSARRYSTSSSPVSLAMSRPATNTSPDVGESMPPKMLSAVVLPAPDAPKMTASSPCSAWNVAPSSA